MKYLKVFTDFLEVTGSLSDAGLGRLFRAMLRYAQDGAEPALKGKEGVAWAVARQHIDREVHAYKVKVASAEAARSCLKQHGSDKENLISEQDNDNDNEKNNDKYKNKDNDFFSSGGRLTAEKKETRPTLEEVMAFSQQTGLKADAQLFFDADMSQKTATQKERNPSAPCASFLDPLPFAGERRDRGAPPIACSTAARCSASRRRR